MFQGLNQGASPITQGMAINILDRKEFKIIPATVTSVSAPHVSKGAATNPSMVFQGFVVDVNLSLGNETKSIEFPVNSTFANYNDLGWFVSPDNLVVSREIESMITTSKQFISQVPFNEKVIREGPDMLVILDPGKQKEAKQEEKITSLERQLTAMTDKFNELVGMLSDKINGTEQTKV